MKTVAIQAIHIVARNRGPGYLDAVLAAAKDRTEISVTLDDADYDRIARQFPPLRQRVVLRESGPESGPGAELKKLLKDWLGIEASPTCSCNAMARKMDQRGPEWCESDEGMAEILGVMRAEHAKRWQAGATRLPWSDFGARQLVRLACSRARANASA